MSLNPPPFSTALPPPSHSPPSSSKYSLPLSCYYCSISITKDERRNNFFFCLFVMTKWPWFILQLFSINNKTRVGYESREDFKSSANIHKEVDTCTAGVSQSCLNRVCTGCSISLVSRQVATAMNMINRNEIVNILSIPWTAQCLRLFDHFVNPPKMGFNSPNAFICCTFKHLCL